jgi:hypothetical protein
MKKAKLPKDVVRFIEDTTRSFKFITQSGGLIKKIELSGVQFSEIQVVNGFIRIYLKNQPYNEALATNIVECIWNELGYQYSSLIQPFSEDEKWGISINADAEVFNPEQGKPLPWWKRLVNWISGKRELKKLPHEYVTVTYERRYSDIVLHFHRAVFKMETTTTAIERDKKNLLSCFGVEK